MVKKLRIEGFCQLILISILGLGTILCAAIFDTTFRNTDLNDLILIAWFQLIAFGMIVDNNRLFKSYLYLRNREKYLTSD